MKKRDKRKRMRKKQERLQGEGLQRTSGIVSIAHMQDRESQHPESDEPWGEQSEAAEAQ